ncbi:MAG TPA: hypothetical protein VIF62_12825 [Labilithrix sp.]
MPIAGDRPESGVRIAIERARDGGPPWRYEGHAYTPHASADIRVVVQADGAVDVDGPADLAEKVRLIVRAAFKQAAADGAPPARRIVRWRGEK